MNKEAKRFLKYIGVLMSAVVLAFGLGKLLHSMRPKNVNSEQTAHKMALEIVSAKPGAILVSTDGQLLHFEYSGGGLNSMASYNMYGAGNNRREPALLGKIVARVVNQDDPGYDKLARRYLNGGHVDPHPSEPPM